MLRCIFLTFTICLTALIGDAVLDITSENLYRAIIDSATHGLVGLFSWAVVLCKSASKSVVIVSKTFEILLSGTVASLVDVDHFIYNRSLDINAALHLDMSLESFLNEFEEDDGEDEVLTASAVLHVLTEAWINEKLCPELLPHKSEYVDVMMEQIAQMEENVSRLNTTDLRNLIHRQELERIRYLLRSYLRLRLMKIEKYSLFLFKTTDIMSPQETNYLRDYLTLSVEPLKSLCDRMSGPIGNLNPKQIEIAPDLETHVFIKSKCDLPEALVINDDEILLKKGSQQILPYSAVKDYIKDNRIVLI